MGKAEKNPVKGLRFFKEKNENYRFLSEEEIQRLLSVTSGTLHLIILTAVVTGMRRGEILALEWEHVDLGRGIITVADSKSGDFRRIPINPVLTKELKSVKMMGEYSVTL